MTVADPYPETLAEVDDTALGFAPPAPLTPEVKALNRIATALEQLVLNQMPAQNAPGAVLAALPPVRPVQPVAAQVGGVCPIHGTPWKVVPAGISKKTGNAYEAFAACSTKGCDQRPPR